MRKLLCFSVVALVLLAMQSMSAFALDKSHAERSVKFARLHSTSQKIPAYLADTTLGSRDVECKPPRVPVGAVVKGAGNGVGVPVSETRDDFQWSTYNNAQNTGEAIDLAIDSSGAEDLVDVHFMYEVMSGDTLRTHACYQTYSLNSGEWKFVSAPGGEEVQKYDSVGGIIGDLEVSTDPPGLVILATADRYGEFYPDSLFDSWGYYFQQSRYQALPEGGTAGAERGYVPKALWQQFEAEGIPENESRFVAPELEVSNLGGQQVIHCVGIVRGWTQTTYPGCTPLWLNSLVYFHNSSTTPWDQGAWTDGQIVGTSYTHYGICLAAERNGPKVATFMWRWTPFACDSFPFSYDYLDGDIWYTESVDTGHTWSDPANCTNHRRDIQSHTVCMDHFTWDATYDSNGDLHLVYTANPTPPGVYGDRDWLWTYFDDDIMHWTPGSAPNRVASAVYAPVNAADMFTWQSYASCAPTGGAALMAHEPSVAQCGNYLYTTWHQFHVGWTKLTSTSPLADSLAAVSDCAMNTDEPSGGANAELMVSVSTDLSGSLWDKPRNLTNTFTPNCEHPDLGGLICGNEVIANLGHQALNLSGLSFSPVWPAGSEVVPQPDDGPATFVQNAYLMVHYLDDAWPGLWWGEC